MAEPTEKTFKIVTLGCRTNQYESQAYQDQLLQMGYRPVLEGEEASLCIVNTCTVTQSAEQQSRSAVVQLGKKNPHAQIAVTGCAAERAPEVFNALPQVHLVPNRFKEELLSHIFPGQELPEFNIRRFEAHTRAFVKVQDGCNSWCSYCIIPHVRGRSRSRKLKELLEEGKTLIQNGYQEIVLTGINIGDFDGAPEEGEPPLRLADLVRAFDQLPGLKRLRISSIDPDEVDDDLADAVLNGKTTCNSLHLVLQSGSNAVLKRMNRKYTKQIFLATVDKLRSIDPDFSFTTDVIVGFPGEITADYEDTLDLLEEVGFVKVHMFPFSPRPKTRAAIMPNQILPEVMQERKQGVMRLSEKIAYKIRESYVGRRVEVLTEQSEGTRSFGHTKNFLGVFIDALIPPNTLVAVDVIENTAEGLLGRAIAV